MVEQKPPYIACNRNESSCRYPAAHTPGEIVDGNQPSQHSKSFPHPMNVVVGQDVNNIFYSVLRTNRATYTCRNGQQYHNMSELVLSDCIPHELHGSLLEMISTSTFREFQVILQRKCVSWL
jgi:hypothetical protein